MNSDHAKRILHYLKTRQDDMVWLLSRCAQIESPSTDPDAQQQVFDVFEESLRDLGFRCRRYSGKQSGGQLMAIAKELPRDQPKQLLLGHVDTVWPHGTLETMPVESKEGCLHGPGVYDMKGGLVQAIFALAALRQLGLQPSVTPVFFMNSDEEIGSRESAQHIRRLARIVDRAMIMEPSLGPSGELKTTRKGVGRFIVTVRGKAAHAGLNPEKGISAILELSHVVQALFALNDPEKGVTVNVGTIDGGMRRGIPEEDWGLVVTVYGDAEQIARFTGNADSLPGRIVLLDESGEVAFFHDRGYSVGTLRRLQAALTTLQQESTLEQP